MENKANAEVVSKMEYNKMKRKLELEIQKRKKQMKLMEALIAKGFPTKRTRICLTVPDFTNKAMEEIKAPKNFGQFSVFSDPVDVAGFEWKLEAYGCSAFFAFFLHAFSPASHAEGFFEFEVDYSFHLYGNTPFRDIHKAAKENTAKGFVVSECDDLIMIWKSQNEEQMLTFRGNFLQPDGSIQVELDFCVQSAKFCEDDEEEEESEESGDDNEENVEKETGKK